jgi:hypothetical protein
MDVRWHSNVLNVFFVKRIVCDADHCPMVAKFMESFSVNERAT